MRDPILIMSTLVRFGAARRVSLYNQLQPLLAARQLHSIVAYVERAREHDRDTVKLEARWNAQQYVGKHNAKLTVLDPLADRLLSGMQQVSEVPIIGLPPAHPLVLRVRAMQNDLFPAGVHAVTTLAYVDQIVHMEEALGKLQGEYASLVKELGMQRAVDRLAEVTRDYRVAVDAGHGRISFEQVDELRMRGHIYLLEIVAMMAARFHDADDPGHADARAELLAPVIEHNTAVVRENRLRRVQGGADEEPDEVEEEPDASQEEPDGDGQETTGDGEETTGGEASLAAASGD